MGLEVSVSEFKARCLEFFERLARGELDEIHVTKRGKRVAVVRDPGLTLEEARRWHGAMRASTLVRPGVDLTASHAVDEEFDPELPTR